VVERHYWSRRGNNENRFMTNISCGVGDGKNIGFWRFKWFGDQSFSVLFPNLFSKEPDCRAMAMTVNGHGIGYSSCQLVNNNNLKLSKSYCSILP
jgi:hypothetical protein